MKMVFNRFFFLCFGFVLDTDKSDQSTAESWWRSHITTPGGDVSIDNNYFSATHGLVQTHPALSSGISRPTSMFSLPPSSSSSGSDHLLMNFISFFCLFVCLFRIK